MKLITLVNVVLFFFSVSAFAQWAHESELGMVIVDGNSESKSTNVKQQTSYTWDKNKVETKANYTEAEQNDVKSAQSWNATLRYERAISEKLSAFVAHGAEGDRFAGYLQRDNSDIGAKYTFYALENKDTWFAELGYRAIKTDVAYSDKEDSTSNARFYSEIVKTFREGLSGKFWAEYVADLDDSEIYFVNAEPSLSVMLNSVFSLKLSYLIKYQNIIPAGAEHTDTTFATALVAKF